MQMSAIIGVGANCGDAVQRLAGAVETLLPAIEERGLEEPGEIEADTLAQCLIDDVTASASFAVASSDLTAWSPNVAAQSSTPRPKLADTSSQREAEVGIQLVRYYRYSVVR